MNFDDTRAWLKGPDFFPRFVVTDERLGRLADSKLPADTELMIADVAGESMAFVAGELASPHMAQGTLAGKPYLVTF